MLHHPKVAVLVLGVGPTGRHILNLCASRSITTAGTTRDGCNNTIPFTFDPSSTDPAPYQALPTAQTIVITFPFTAPESPKTLLSLYESSHPSAKPHYILLGSTSAFPASLSGWTTRNSPLDPSIPRVIAESALLDLHCPPTRTTTVLHLAGLCERTGSRKVSNWIPRAVPNAEALKKRTVLHLIAMEDVARVCIGLKDGMRGQRWIVTDMCVHDYWEVVWAVGSEEAKGWVREELEREMSVVRALPRGFVTEGKERMLDSRELWKELGISPGWSLY
ncbi:hypothetical protein BJ742DRAFT_766113 [Cladochytrium replicatum]|nr:hypothetical protein BJ742DRAFT_766113 [Cladochytrium replicatum]